MRPSLAKVTPLRPAAIPLRSPAEAAQAGVAAAPIALVVAVVERVRARLKREAPEGAGGGDASQLLDVVSTSVQEVLRSGAIPPGGPAATPLGRHLLELVRGEMLRSWRAVEPPADPVDVLAVLEATFTVHRAIEPEEWEAFRNRLSGPDGLDLVVGVAHDLRSPLTSILFLAETLSRGRSGAVNELQARQLRLIYSAALGLNSLASDVIELARGGDRLIETDPEAFSLGEMLESLHDMVRPIAEEKGLEIRYNLPPSDRRIGRPLLLSRVLLNLVTNSLKFTDAGYVDIHARATGITGVEFAVSDTGHGISADALAHLYEPFQKRTSRRSKKGQHFSGTGLGLAMCRRLVEAMGAELKCESAEGQGTRFWFEVDLPIESRM